MTEGERAGGERKKPESSGPGPCSPHGRGGSSNRDRETSQCRGRKPRREDHPGKWAQQGESAEREANDHRLGSGGLLVTMTRAG